MTNGTLRLALMTLAGPVLVTGCAQWQANPTPVGDGPGPAAQLRSEIEQSAPPAEPVTPPPEVSEALLPPIRIGDGATERPEARYDIDVDDAEAAAFFASLVAGTPYNVVVHPEVSGRISLTLKDVTVPEVLEVVREVYGYEYRREAAGYIVMPRQLRTRIFQVNYLDLQRRGRSITQVSSGELSRNGNGSGSDGGESSQDSATGRESIGSAVSTRTESDLWRELGQGVRTIIGTENGRKVIVSPQASMVVVRGMPSELREVQEFLSTAENNLQRQVILEAKVLEVRLSDGFQSGINWAALAQPGSDDENLIIGSQTGGGTIFSDAGVSDIAGQTGTTPGEITNTLASAFGGVFSAAITANDFTAFIELLERQGDVQVLSSPRVSTVNNQKAVIKVGSDEFFATDVSSNTSSTSTTTTTSPEIELTPFFSGIALDVTPQISANGEVILHVNPTISEVEDQRKEFTIGGELQSIPLALSTVRESDSIIRARSGQIVVIGGLMQERTEQEVASTPLLGDLPVIGGLFRHTRTVSEKTELVILLRPIVVQGRDDWRRAVEGTSERLRRLVPEQGAQQ